MTFSIIGRCEKSGMVGVAITTSSIAVGSRCPWVRAGVGAVATQNITLPSIGADVLSGLAGGDTPDTALAKVVNADGFGSYRQVTVIDKNGNSAIHSGSKTLGTNATANGVNCVAAGNLLASEALPAVMTAHFEQNAQATLPERLLSALESGLYDGGGELGTVHSAALLVAHQHPWALVDLRVDWDDTDPIRALRKLWEAYQPQMQDYVTRAINPAAAPSYGVPGDE